MQYVSLGRTGLRASVAGLGCGGFSCLGLATGGSEAAAIRIIHGALERGVNVFDTAPSYGTEEILGKALAQQPRRDLIVSTKTHINRAGHRIAPEQILESLERSLRALAVDHVDVFYLHSVKPADYAYATDVVLPLLQRQRELGKIRFLGLSEAPYEDLHHSVARRAAEEGSFDVVMPAFHLMHQSARTDLFPVTLKRNIGTVLMYVVRGIFAKPERLMLELERLSAQGMLRVPPATAFDLLRQAGGSSHLTEVAYRFARHEPGVGIVLFGTGNEQHLADNIDSIMKPALSPEDHSRIVEMFGHLVGVGLDRTARSGKA